MSGTRPLEAHVEEVSIYVATLSTIRDDLSAFSEQATTPSENPNTLPEIARRIDGLSGVLASFARRLDSIPQQDGRASYSLSSEAKGAEPKQGKTNSASSSADNIAEEDQTELDERIRAVGEADSTGIQQCKEDLVTTFQRIFAMQIAQENLENATATLEQVKSHLDQTELETASFQIAQHELQQVHNSSLAPADQFRIVIKVAQAHMHNMEVQKLARSIFEKLSKDQRHEDSEIAGLERLFGLIMSLRERTHSASTEPQRLTRGTRQRSRSVV